MSNNLWPPQRPCNEYIFVEGCVSLFVSVTKYPRKQLKGRQCVLPWNLRQFHCFWVYVEAEGQGSGNVWRGNWSLWIMVDRKYRASNRCEPSGHTPSDLLLTNSHILSTASQERHWVICFIVYVATLKFTCNPGWLWTYNHLPQPPKYWD